MTSIDLTIMLHSDIVPPPSGWKLFRATKWPIVELGLSYETFGGSSFQVVPLWIPEVKNFSAISSFSFITRSAGDIDRLIDLQPKDVDIKKKMNWLVAAGTGVCPMWTGTEAGWDTADEYRVGTMLWGSQIFAASEEVFYLNTSIGYGAYRKVMPFQKADWQKDHKRYPYLFPRAGICGPKGAISFDWDGRGEIRTMLQVLDPADYKFAGSLKPSAFYALERWCLPFG